MKILASLQEQEDNEAGKLEKMDFELSSMGTGGF